MPASLGTVRGKAQMNWFTAAILTIAVCLLALPGPGLWTKAGVVGAAAVSVLAVRRSQARWTGVVLVLWGLLGLALGLAVGVRHLLAGRLTLAPLALVAGGFLVVAGLRTLLRALSRPTRAAGTAALVLGGLVCLYLLVIPLLTTQPLPAAAPGPPPTGFSEVAFDTSDGVTLRGWYAATDNGAAVVVVPGSGSSRTGAAKQARRLADAGFGVLVYDPRGHGASDGQAMDTGWAGDADVTAAVTFASGQPGVRAIGALGLSMGGEQVLGAAAGDPRISAIVAEGATNRVAADLAWLPDWYGARGAVQLGLEHAKQAITALLTPYPAPGSLREALRAIGDRPVLIITAGQRPDEYSAAIHNGPGVEIWNVEEAGHTGALAADPDAWQQRVVGFFEQALLDR